MKTFGQIAGGVGLLLLLTSPVSYFIQGAQAAGFAAALGVGLVGAWFVTHRQEAAEIGNRLFFFGSSALYGVLGLAFLVALNFTVSQRNKTWDLTAKKLNSLSPQTVNVLQELKSPVKIIAFAEQPISTVEQLVKKYAAANPLVSFEFKDPNRANDLTRKYDVRKGQLAAVLIKNPGPEETHQLVNLGNLAQPADGEQTLTNALIKLSTVGQQKLYFIQGHGELALKAAPGQTEVGEEMPRGLNALTRDLENDGYSPEPLNLLERGEVPPDASAIVIAHAKTKFSDREKGLLERYLEAGGRVVYLADINSEPDLDSLLASYGIQVNPGIVADSKMNAGQPYAVVAPSFGDSDIARPLKKQEVPVVAVQARALTVLREGLATGVTASPVVLTGPNAWEDLQGTETPTLDSGERSGQLPLVVQSTRPTPNAQDKRTSEARLVVLGDATLAMEGYSHAPNRDLVLNTIAWTTQQAQKITIRPPDRDTSTIDLDQSRFNIIRLVTLQVLPTVLLAIGIAISRTRRAR
jgi:ABC-type uncharacterized transport system involved in gliding motility auxiliary subunit